jgi:hypothetical protein
LDFDHQDQPIKQRMLPRRQVVEQETTFCRAAGIDNPPQ